MPGKAERRFCKSNESIRLDRVRLGNIGDCKAVGGGIHELRIDYEPGYRVYFAHKGNKIILLLFGGEKSRGEDIALASEFWNDHKRRTTHA